MVDPLAFKAGETVAVQFGEAPPKTMLATGNSVVFEEVAETEVPHTNVLSGSVIVKLIINGVSSGVI